MRATCGCYRTIATANWKAPLLHTHTLMRGVWKKTRGLMRSYWAGGTMRSESRDNVLFSMRSHLYLLLLFAPHRTSAVWAQLFTTSQRPSTASCVSGPLTCLSQPDIMGLQTPSLNKLPLRSCTRLWTIYGRIMRGHKCAARGQLMWCFRWATTVFKSHSKSTLHVSYLMPHTVIFKY